jgi:hypothetical protein
MESNATKILRANEGHRLRLLLLLLLLPLLLPIFLVAAFAFSTYYSHSSSFASSSMFAALYSASCLHFNRHPFHRAHTKGGAIGHIVVPANVATACECS